MTVNVNLVIENEIQIKSGKTMKRPCECKNTRKHHISGKKYIWNPSTCAYENGKYLGRFIGALVIMCYEIIGAMKTVPTIFNERKVSCEIENVYTLLSFLLFTISLLKIFSIYCFFIKHCSRQ